MILQLKRQALKHTADIYLNLQTTKKRLAQKISRGPQSFVPTQTSLGTVTCTGKDTWGLHFTDQKGTSIRIDFLAPGIIRVSIRQQGFLRLDRSWSVCGKAGDVPQQGRLKDDYSVFDPIPFEVENHPEHVSVTLPGSEPDGLQLVIQLDPFSLQLLTAEHTVLAADTPAKAYRFGRYSSTVCHRKILEPGAALYGFGETSGPLNKRGRRLRMMSLDALGYDPVKQDPLYKQIPFYIQLSPQTDKPAAACGIFYDNLCTALFDAGKTDSSQIIWQADDGDIDYYLLPGPKIKDVVHHYTRLTGQAILQPRWSLGYLGSTMTYTEAPDAHQQLLEFIRLCKEHDIPCSLFHLSSGYTSGARNKRYVFNWNREKIPSPQAMVSDFHNAEIKLSANIKPCLLTTHPLYDEVARFGGFITNKDGKTPHVTPFWGGKGSYLDFLNPATCQWWQDKIQDTLLQHGIDSTWNDNNEYEIWNEKCQCHPAEGPPWPTGLVRPVQPLLMSQASKKAQQSHAPELRPYLISRSAIAGIQRYAQTWTGDNHTNWKTLQYNIPMGLNLGLSGLSNSGHDIGGFFGFKPSPELFLRWVQSAVFMPRFTIHSWHLDKSVNEPWMYPQILPAIREAIKFRYMLIPYLYSLLVHHCQSGEPLNRPLIYEFQNDPNCREASFEFLCGPGVLVAPVYEPGARQRTLYLPDRCNPATATQWIDFYTGTRYQGGSTVTLNAPADHLPVVVEAGSIIVLGEQAGATEAARKICLYPASTEKESKFICYEDDGETLDYTKGIRKELHYRMHSTKDSIHLEIQATGNYQLPYSVVEVILPPEETRPLHSNLPLKRLDKDKTTRHHYHIDIKSM